MIGTYVIAAGAAIFGAAVGAAAAAGRQTPATPKAYIVTEVDVTGDKDVFHKLRKDFDAKGVDQSDHQIRRTMQELMEKAVAQIKAGS